nr:GNAT family N-acetyltransferase [Litorivivens lipolytica]
MRNAVISDSEFILSLRLDPDKGRYLSATVPSLVEQEAWMQKYEKSCDQAYFIIQSKDGRRLGCVRMYNPSGKSFEWGSWLMISGAPPFAALESALLIYRYAVDLGFEEARLEVRQDNVSVWKFHENVFGARLVDESERDRFYIVEKSMIKRVLRVHAKRLRSYKSLPIQ